jgi:outer membrane protein TolC
VEAESEARRGAAMRRPDLGVHLRAVKEGADRIIVAGLTVAVPWFNHGQDLIAAGTARAARLRLERDTAERAAIAEVSALHEEYMRRRRAAAAFEEALPAAADNQQLSQRSFEEGELSLRDLVVVRREVIDTRLEHLDLLFEAAQTAVARDAAAGVLK